MVKVLDPNGGSRAVSRVCSNSLQSLGTCFPGGIISTRMNLNIPGVIWTLMMLLKSRRSKSTRRWIESRRFCNPCETCTSTSLRPRWEILGNDLNPFEIYYPILPFALADAGTEDANRQIGRFHTPTSISILFSSLAIEPRLSPHLHYVFVRVSHE